jgi:purine-binding chemotaxis protein CheW
MAQSAKNQIVAMERDEQAVEHAQYLTFVVGGETYGIGILGIKEILEYGTITRVPLMPETIRGVINLRGSVVPVVDLSARFGGAPTEATKRSCVVILEMEHEEGRETVGMLVDNVNEVLEIAPQDIEPAPSFGARIRTDFIAGMARVEELFVILLDVDHVLSMDELAALAEVRARMQAPAPEHRAQDAGR